MRYHQLAIVCGWLFVAATAFGQDAPAKRPQPKEQPPQAAPAPAPQPVETAAPVSFEPAFPSEIIWFKTDFLLWSVPNSNVPFPVVTTGTPTDDCFAGVIGNPNTSVLFGNQNFSNDHTNGLRVTLGGWLDNSHDYGIEASGFTIFRETHAAVFSSDKSGNPGLYLSGFNTQLNREDSAIIADPLQKFGGTIRVATDLGLFGVEINGLFNIRRNANFEWTFLSGARYLDFRESFGVSAVSRDLILNQQITLDDQFKSSNQFLGYQAGSRMRWRAGNWLFDLTGKLALGGNQRTVLVNGRSTSGGPDATNPGNFVGGFYAQPSNIGRETDIVMCIMPAVELKLAYQITSGMIASIGYDMMYLNQTVRVANQVDRNLNLSQSAVLGSPAPSAPLTPRRGLDSSDLFVNGLSLGLEIRY